MKIRREHWPALWLLLILALVAAVRIRELSLPLERDEGEYAYAGQLMLEGVPPYRLLYNMKMPGIYAAYAVIMAVFGQSAAGIRFGFMLVNFGAIVLLYFVGRRFLDRAGAVAACAAYALMSTCIHLQGFNAHATHFVVLAALGAILVLLRALESGRAAGFFWSGALFGLAFLMKQHGGAFAFFGAGMIAWSSWRQTAGNWKTGAVRCALYAAGVALPIVLTGWALWQAGVWDKFWWWTVSYARVHATSVTWEEGRIRLAGFFTDWFWDGSFWILALAGLFCLLRAKGRMDEKFFFLSLLAFSFLAITPAFNFTNHYFVLMLPVVALLAAKAFGTAAEWLAAQPSALVRAAPWIVFGLVWGGAAWSNRGPFWSWNAGQFSTHIYDLNEFQVYPVIAEHLARESPATATMAVFGSEPELPFYAHRRSVTGYIYMYDLVEEQPFRERMEKEMISEVERGRADFLIFVNTYLSWLPFPPGRGDGLRDWMMAYIQNEYVPYGAVTVAPHQYFWGPDCLRHIPAGHQFVVLFQRKRAVPAVAPLPKSAP